jgi:hypothetical protein
MAGDWRNAANPAGARERWIVAPGGVLMGSAWEGSQDGKGYAEIMTVRDEMGSIHMVLRHFDLALSKAWEERTAPMVFAASSLQRHIGSLRRSGRSRGRASDLQALGRNAAHRG